MGIKQFIVVFSFLIPITISCQNYPRFELYQLKQGTDSGQFIVTGLDSNLAFNNILRFRSADSTLLIGLDTVAVKSDIASSLLGIIDAGLGIEVNEVDGKIVIESLSIEDSIKNQTGTLIEKGTPLYATGVQGNYWTVAPADASDPNKMPVVVIAGEDIADGETGLGLIKGHIKQVSTVGLASGAEVYVASGGGYTSTKPTAEGVIIQRLGTVIKGNSANGSGIINLGDEAYWNDYVDRTELGDSLALYPNRIELGDSLLLYPNRIELGDSTSQLRADLISNDLTYNYAWIGNVSNEPAEVLATSSSTANTLIRRDANQRFASGFITMDEGINNIGIGSDGFFQNLQTSSGINNIAIGSRSGSAISTQDANVLIGSFTGEDLTGSSNTFVGVANNSNSTNINNSTNIGLGGDALGNYSVGVGNNNSASLNGTAIGYGSTARRDAVGIGYGTFANADGIAIGSNVTALTNEIVIGNSNNTSLKANNYKFNIDQSVLGKNGFVLTYNAVTQEIELDSAASGGGAVGGIDSVIADQVTILGNGVDQTLRVDTTNTIATRKFVLDNSGGGGSQWVTSGSDIYYNTGNVGIGNNSPSYKLHVTGTSFVDGSLLVANTLYLGNGTGTQYPYILGTAGKMYFNSYDVLTSGALYTFTDRVGSVNPLVLYGTTATNQMVVQGNSNLNGALNVEGNLTQTGSIVQDGGSVTFNNTQNASYDFGVGSLNHLPFMWVDASADKMAVGGGTPQYTLDVTGDINFTNKLYQNGVEVTFGGGGEEYVFTGQFKSKTDFYIPLPSNVYTCTIDRASFVADFSFCSSCTFVYSTGSISSNTYTSSNTLWTYTPAGASGLVREENALSQTVNSSNNVLRVDFTGTVTIDWLHTSIIVSCN
jgi:hypothetical protein